jgi:hypothetical protein
MFTLEPSSTGDKGWDDFLIDFNDFASRAGGVPTFNQSRALQPEHVAKAFGERVKLFRALRRATLRQRTDPLNRLCNSYFAHLLGETARCTATALPQALSCRCASRNHRYLSISRESR